MHDVAQPGAVVAKRYRIERELGAGGFATVYVATDLTNGRTCALKLLKPERDGYAPTTVARFDREAAVLSTIRAPNIVWILDHGSTDEGLLYLVFELLPGEDLSTLLGRRDRLEAREAIHILRQLLAALDVAHSHGVIHRDVKPENVRLIANGSDPMFVKLMDFGIARPTDSGSPTVTATGELIGTPRYMSPEQLTSRPLGPASDLYSLGVLGLEMLIGRGAMHGNRWSDQLDRLHSGHVFALPGLGKDDVGLLRVLNRMTARDIPNRYASAHAVLSALDEMDAGPKASAQPKLPTAPGHAPRVFFGVAVGMAIAVFAITAYLLDSPAPRVTVPPATRVPAAGPGAAKSVEPTRPTDAGAEGEVGAPAPLDGCGQDPLPTGYLDFAFRVPSDYDPSHRHPVIVLLHDDGQSPDEWLERGGFGDLADDKRVIVIAPRGSPVPDVGISKLNFSAWRRGPDIEWIRKLVTTSVTRTANSYCVDLGRIFALGQGHGGSAANIVSCDPWLAGSATNAHHYDLVFDCAGKRKPMLVLLPNANGQMPMEGGRNCRGKEVSSFAGIIADWRTRNGCSSAAVATKLNGGECTEWTCETPFTSCILSGGRPWPGMPLMNDCDGRAPTQFESTRVVWEFFAAQNSVPPEDQIPLE